VLGVGQSTGGHALVDAAAAAPEAFRGLVLLDPVIGPPESYADGESIAQRFDDSPHPTAKRRNRFESPRAMFERFEGRRPYSLFDPACLHDYCEYGLLPDPSGEGFVLACPPETEASIYRTSRTNGSIFDSVHKLTIPVLVVRARGPEDERDPMGFSFSPTWPGLARALPNGLDVHLPERTHFLPMEDPEGMAALVVEHEAARVDRDAGDARRGSGP
jgi:pimeloyl-ACP methyl ester carboxylesterase